MKLKNFLMLILLMAFGVLLVACGDKAEVTISLDADFVTTVGERATLKPTVNGTEEDVRFVFESSAPAVIEVDQTGYIRALSAGDAIVTVSLKEYPEVEATVNIKVNPKITLGTFTPTKITLEGDDEMAVGTSQELTVNLEPANAHQALFFESSDTAVLEVTADGKVFAHAMGTATVTAKSALNETVTGTLEITVAGEGTDEEIAEAAVDYVKAMLPQYVTETFTLPVHPSPEVETIWETTTGTEIEEYELIAEADSEDKVKVTVVYNEVEVTETVTLKVTVDANNNVHEKIKFIVADLNAYFENLRNEETNKIEVTGDLDLYAKQIGVNIVWATNAAGVISKEGEFVRPNNDTDVKLTATIGSIDLSQILVFDVVAKGYDAEEKVEYMLEEGSLKPFIDAVTSYSLYLPVKDEKFGATFAWESSDATVIDNNGDIKNFALTEDTEITYTVTVKYDVKGFEFEDEVEIKVTVKPLDEAAKAAKAFADSDFTMIPHVVAGGTTGVPGKIADLPTSVEGHEGVTITWYGRDGIFDTEMNVIAKRVLYTETEVFAKFSKEGSLDAIVVYKTNIGLLASADDFAFSARSGVYTGADHDPRDGMPAADGGTGVVYALGFEKFVFKSNHTITVGEGEDAQEITKDWYFIFAPGNLQEVKAEHLTVVEGKKVVDKTKEGAKLAPQWGSTTRFFKNTTEETIYINAADVKDLGAQISSDAYKPFVIDKDGKVTTLPTPIVTEIPEGFTQFEIPAGGMLVCPAYLEVGVAGGSIFSFAQEIGQQIEILPLAW